MYFFLENIGLYLHFMLAHELLQKNNIFVAYAKKDNFQCSKTAFHDTFFVLFTWASKMFFHAKLL
jgi:hypothetical protein